MTARLLLLLLLAIGIVRAGDSSPAGEGSGWKWNFQLLPTSLQKRPKVAMTFFTEMTDAGRKLEAPSAKAPAYYLIHAGKPQSFGENTNRTPPPQEADLRATVLRTLEAAHYHEASPPEHPPTLILIYYWGVHAGINDLTAEIDPTQAMRNLYQRAHLIGGEKFAETWRRAREDDDLRRDSMALVYGVSSDEYKLQLKSEAVRKLLAQAREDVYFVVVTAYDAAALAREEKVVLWRTKMTVSARGMAMRESIAPLIAASAPYLGRETVEARPVSHRIYRDGRVELGPLEVLGVEEPSADDETDEPAPSDTAGPASPPAADTATPAP
ncbi:MAG: hypothetical protein IAE82_05510 [Opitutaceae bacterium]|nr:hypothetical protein [Opitutaceae bacterium]